MLLLVPPTVTRSDSDPESLPARPWQRLRFFLPSSQSQKSQSSLSEEHASVCF